MKANVLLLAALWFSGSVYAGYRLTEHSFAWIAVSGFGLPSPAASNAGAVQTEPSSGSPTLLEQLKHLSPEELACLRATIAPARITAALQGHLTPEETAAAMKCFQ